MKESENEKRLPYLQFKRECFSNHVVRILQISEKFEVDPYKVYEEFKYGSSDELAALLKKYELKH